MSGDAEPALSNEARELHSAIHGGQVESAAKILAEAAHNSDKVITNELNEHGQSAVHLCATTPNFNADLAFRVLEFPQTKLNLADAEGFTPLHLAAKFDQVELIKPLSDRLTLTQLNTQHLSFGGAIHIAVWFKRLAVLNELLSIRQIVKDQLGPNKQSPLHLAILLGYTEGVRALIDGGAWIDVVDDCGRRPLLFACYAPSSSRGDYAIPTNGGEHDFMDKKAPENAIFSLLVESGAKIDSGVRDLSTTLHWAAFSGNAYALSTLLVSKGGSSSSNGKGSGPGRNRRGAVDVFARDTQGRNALHYLVEGLVQRENCSISVGERYVACLEILLDDLLRLDLLDKHGRPPWFALAKTRWRAGEVLVLAHLLPLIRGSMNTQDAAGYTLLHLLAQRKDYSSGFFDYLIDSKLVNPALIDANGESALIHAIRCENIGMVKRLLAIATNGEASLFNPKTLQTALHVAAMQGNEEIARLLIDSGCDLNAKDKDDLTPLMTAVRHGKTAVALLLLASPGVDLFAVDASHRSVFHFLALVPNGVDVTEVLNILAELAAAVGNNGRKSSFINGLDKHGHSPLVLAALQIDEKPELLAALLDSGATVLPQSGSLSASFEERQNGYSNNKRSLSLTTGDGREDVVTVVKPSCTALHSYVARPFIASSLLERLIDLFKNECSKMTQNGLTASNPLTLSPGGSSPLHVACLHRNETAIRMLLESQLFDVNAPDDRGNTALHCCLVAGDVKCALLLISSVLGAVINAVDVDDLNIVQLAALSDTFINSEDWKKLLDVAEPLLRQTDKLGRTAAFFAAFAGNVVALEAILAADIASGSIGDKMKWNSLHAAALSDQSEVARILLDSDRGLAEAQDLHGRTPALLAAANGSHQFLEALFDEDVDVVKQADEKGWTVAHYAAALGDRAALHIARNSTVTTPLVDHEDRTPLHIAAAAGKIGVLALLAEDYETSAGDLQEELERQDKEGRTPRELALVYGHRAAANKLIFIADNVEQYSSESGSFDDEDDSDDEDDYESSFNPFEVETGENPSSSTDSGMILERSWSELTALESSEEDEEDEKDDEDFAELRRWRSPEVSATPAPSPALPSKLPLVEVEAESWGDSDEEMENSPPSSSSTPSTVSPHSPSSPRDEFSVIKPEVALETPSLPSEERVVSPRRMTNERASSWPRAKSPSSAASMAQTISSPKISDMILFNAIKSLKDDGEKRAPESSVALQKKNIILSPKGKRAKVGRREGHVEHKKAAANVEQLLKERNERVAAFEKRLQEEERQFNEMRVAVGELEALKTQNAVLEIQIARARQILDENGSSEAVAASATRALEQLAALRLHSVELVQRLRHNEQERDAFVQQRRAVECNEIELTERLRFQQILLESEMRIARKAGSRQADKSACGLFIYMAIVALQLISLALIIVYAFPLENR